MSGTTARGVVGKPTTSSMKHFDLLPRLIIIITCLIAVSVLATSNQTMTVPVTVSLDLPPLSVQASANVLRVFCLCRRNNLVDFREATCRQYENTFNHGGYFSFMHFKKISRELRRQLFGRYRRRHSRSRSWSPCRNNNYEEWSHGGRGQGRRSDDRDQHAQ